jgi:hypothetical protein
MIWLVALFRPRLRDGSKSKQLLMLRNQLKLFEIYSDKNRRNSLNRHLPKTAQKSPINQ